MAIRKKPESIGSAIEQFLTRTGLAARVEQAVVVPEWETLVGAQIAAVTEPRSVTADGTLFVAVRTHAWMTELSLMEPELLHRLNERASRSPIHRIRWMLLR